MASENDVRALKAARSEFAKRAVDTTNADLRIHNGIIQIRGLLRPMKGATYSDLKSEVEIIARVLRQKGDIKDVVVDCQLRSV